MKKIRITSGEHKGRYVGPNYSGLRTKSRPDRQPRNQVIGNAILTICSGRCCIQLHRSEGSTGARRAEGHWIGFGTNLISRGCGRRAFLVAQG